MIKEKVALYWKLMDTKDGLILSMNPFGIKTEIKLTWYNIFKYKNEIIYNVGNDDDERCWKLLMQKQYDNPFYPEFIKTHEQIQKMIVDNKLKFYDPEKK